MSFKIVVTVPLEHADAVRKAMGGAGAGKIGNYAHCSFSIKGTGRFQPGKGANPHLGREGHLESVEEERIEMSCEKEHLTKTLQALCKTHPYEEPAIDIYPLYVPD